MLCLTAFKQMLLFLKRKWNLWKRYSWCFLIWTKSSEKWVCFFNFIPNGTLNSMQVLMVGNVVETDYSHRYGEGRGGCEEVWEEMIGNYTCDTQHWAHIPLMQSNSSTTGKTLKCLRMFCVMIKIHSYTQKSHSTSHILKAISIFKPSSTSKGIPTTYHN